MALTKRQRPTLDWPGDFFRQFFDDRERSSWLRVEEFEDGGQLVIRAEIPGVDPAKDVEVSVTGDTLRIHAERQEKSETTEKAGYRSEFRYGSFTRDLALPDNVEADDIKATYSDGILEVRAPILEATKKTAAKVIPVTT